MPIYKGLGTASQKNIITNNKEMQKVYVGDKLIWQKTIPIFYPKNGVLYNFYTIIDPRNIASLGWDVANDAQWSSLITSMGGSSVAGGKLKETGFVYWGSPNTGATNLIGFNMRGSGLRRASGSGYDTLIWYGFNWTKTSIDSANARSYNFASNLASLYIENNYKKEGHSIRVCRPTANSDGTSGLYLGNDLKLYRTISNNGIEWVADSLCETKYRNGDTIPEISDDTAWIALNTGALCAYNNNWDNV